MADQQDNREFRYVNLGPARIRAKMESEQDPSECEALMAALKFWESKAPGREVSAGRPYRGEPRNAIRADSLASLVSDIQPVEHIFVGPCLSSGSTIGDDDIFDWDMLAGD